VFGIRIGLLFGLLHVSTLSQFCNEALFFPVAVFYRIVTSMVCESSWLRRNCVGYQGSIKGWVSWAATWGANL